MSNSGATSVDVHISNCNYAFVFYDIIWRTTAKRSFCNSYFFFIIATNWKTIHHINIIVVSQKMENKIKQHLYIFATVLDNVDIYM